MKKSLVITLALVFVLGIAGTALAANPFTDVPANHWAYASISKLAQSGIIDGYGDGRFIGNNTMTRYEMAQIVAKAMARVDSADASQRSQIEKLAAEFADELDSLGVRVAKLEKNSDNVKITGEARFGWQTYDNRMGTARSTSSDSNETLRTRLYLSGQVNDKWTYGAMYQNEKDFRTNDREQTGQFRRAFVTGKLGDVTVMAGRFYYKPVAYGIVLDQDSDGIMLGYKKDNFKFDIFALRPIFSNKALQYYKSTGNSSNQVYGAAIGYDNKKLDATFAYYHTDPRDHTDTMAVVRGGESVNIYEFALGYRFNKDWKVWGEYLRGSEDINNGGKSGWAAGLNWGSVNRNKPGTIAARFTYYDVPAAAFIDSTPEMDFGFRGAVNDGYKGYQIGATWMMAKNIDFNVDYFDFESQTKNNGRGGKYKNDLLWTYVRFYF